MKVENPRYILGKPRRIDAGIGIGQLSDCVDCPLEREPPKRRAWLRGHSNQCPTSLTYAEACALAESAKAEIEK